MSDNSEANNEDVTTNLMLKNARSSSEMQSSLSPEKVLKKRLKQDSLIVETSSSIGQQIPINIVSENKDDETSFPLWVAGIIFFL